VARMLRLELGEGHDWPWNDRVAEARRLSCKTAIWALPIPPVRFHTLDASLSIAMRSAEDYCRIHGTEFRL